MTERICTCGHKESEHEDLEDHAEMACMHKINDIESADFMFCSCMQFAWDEEAFTRDTLIESNELISALQDKIEAYETPMPCGHLARYAVTADEGTSFCLMCEYEARR